MLDSQLFSDMNIRTADDGLVFAHKILLAATYPGIKMVSEYIKYYVRAVSYTVYTLLIEHV